MPEKIENIPPIEQIGEKLKPIEELLKEKKVLEHQLSEILVKIREFLFQAERDSLKEEKLKREARGVINKIRKIESKIQETVGEKNT